jgi:hypothetical protein
MKFRRQVVEPFRNYALPVISLRKETSKEAVCLVFEKVNTGGVPLSVFELITATRAADGFNLRDDGSAGGARAGAMLASARGRCCRCRAVGLVILRYTSQLEHRPLHALAQRRHRLRQADRCPPPVRVRQHEHAQQVRERQPGDRHRQLRRVGEVGLRRFPGAMLLREYAGEI